MHLPIFIAFPGFAKVFYDGMINIAKFEIWEIKDNVADLFGLNPDEEPYNERFEAFRYESQNFLMNSGFILLMIIANFFLFALSHILRILSRLCCCEIVKKASKKLDNVIYWGFVIRMLLEVSLEFSIISMMDIAVRNWSSWGYVTSYCVSVAAMFSLLFIAIWFRVYLRRQDLEVIRAKMGAAYEGLLAKSASLAVSEWFIYRRMIYAAAAFFGYD